MTDVPCSNTNNWTDEAQKGREMFRKTRAEQANAQTQARQPNKPKIAKVQGDARCPSSKKKLK